MPVHPRAEPVSRRSGAPVSGATESEVAGPRAEPEERHLLARFAERDGPEAAARRRQVDAIGHEAHARERAADLAAPRAVPIGAVEDSLDAR